jgi:predicted dithiol-disulfide oxidoreductase (DUF899 family)
MPSDAQFAAATNYTRWAPGTSDEYIKARNELLKAEWELQDQVESVAALRRALPQGAPMKSYTFTEGPADITQATPIKETTLADLAADGRSVMVYHFMYDPSDSEPCPMCSMAVDTWNSIAVHLAQRLTFVVVAKAEIEKLRAWALKRGWKNLRILSSHGSDFNKDMNFERPTYAPDVKQAPGMSVFKKDAEGVVRHTYTGLPHFDADTVRGNDLLGGFWNLLDLTPEGREDYLPTNEVVANGAK